jgi:hypothetical protein
MEAEDKAGEYHRGLRAFRNNEYQEAVKHLSVAVEYDENNDKAWNALGIACAKVGRYADADLCFENALTLSPDNQVYLKNRRTNAKNLQERKIPDKPSHSILDRLSLDSIPFEMIPLEPKYILAGAGGIILLLILGIFFLSGGFSPAHDTNSTPALIITANVSGNFLVLTNEGGTDLPRFSSFRWKVDNLEIGSNEPGDPATLGVSEGSVARVSLSDLTASNLSQGMRVLVIGTNRQGEDIIVYNERLPPVIENDRPAGGVSRPLQSPPVAPNLSQFREGQVLIDQNGSYWLIVAPPVNGSYTLSKTARNPSGAFVVIGHTNTSVDFKSFEQTATPLGFSSAGGTPAGISGLAPPPVTGVSNISMHPLPLYQPGDLVNSEKSGDAGMMVILGYDEGTDSYKADNLYRYYNGKWGYRISDLPQWFFRQILEREYPYRIDRITMSDVGTGSDSAPPRDLVRYSPGDIISPDIGGTGVLMVILSYNKTDDRYDLDIIRPAYSGGWFRTNTTVREKRAYIERDYPYLIRTIDLEQVRKA